MFFKPVQLPVQLNAAPGSDGRRQSPRHTTNATAAPPAPAIPAPTEAPDEARGAPSSQVGSVTGVCVTNIDVISCTTPPLRYYHYRCNHHLAPAPTSSHSPPSLRRHRDTLAVLL